MRSLTTSAAAAALGLAALAALVLLPRDGDGGADTGAAGVVLGAADRPEPARHRAGGPDEPGPVPLPAHDVDPRDPAAVAVAYLTLAHSAMPEDADGPNRRAVAWAEPGSVPAQVGVVVLDPPAPGSTRTAEVVALAPVTADPGDTVRLYTATVRVAGPAGTATTSEDVDVVLARRPDGRWLVRSAVAAADHAGDD